MNDEIINGTGDRRNHCCIANALYQYGHGGVLGDVQRNFHVRSTNSRRNACASTAAPLERRALVILDVDQQLQVRAVTNS
jgi:hypothetical protein